MLKRDFKTGKYISSGNIFSKKKNKKKIKKVKIVKKEENGCYRLSNGTWAKRGRYKRRKKEKKSNKSIHLYSKRGIIYFIRCKDFVKIGFTKNFRNRFSSIQGGNPFKLELLHYIRGNTIKENELHELFKKYRVRGEWFQLSPKILKYIEKTKNILQYQYQKNLEI